MILTAPVDRQVKDPARRGKVLEGVLSEILQRHIHQPRRRLAHQHLPAVSRRAQPRGVVHVDPPIIAVSYPRGAAVHPHPHPQLAAVRPTVRLQGTLRHSRRPDRLTRIGKRHEEGVALRVDLHPVMGQPHLAQQPMVGDEHLSVRLPERMQQPGGPLDVREQQSHHTHRKIHVPGGPHQRNRNPGYTPDGSDHLGPARSSGSPIRSASTSACCGRGVGGSGTAVLLCSLERGIRRIAQQDSFGFFEPVVERGGFKEGHQQARRVDDLAPLDRAACRFAAGEVCVGDIA